MACDSHARAASNTEVGVPTAFVANPFRLINQARAKAHHGPNHDVIATTPPPQTHPRRARGAEQQGGSLQPWNGSSNTKTVFDYGFLPPSGVFSIPGTIPSGRHRFVLTLNNDLRKRCTWSWTRHARSQLTSTTQIYFYCTIEEVRFMMFYLVSGAPVPDP